MSLKISPFALTDLEESIEYYNLQQVNLGNKFANNVNSIFNRINENSNQFPKEYKKMQKAKLNKFPFHVYFVEKDTVKYILGIFHSSRNPNTMKGRYKIV